jgi:hypothetical protein
MHTLYIHACIYTYMVHKPLQTRQHIAHNPPSQSPPVEALPPLVLSLLLTPFDPLPCDVPSEQPPDPLPPPTRHSTHRHRYSHRARCHRPDKVKLSINPYIHVRAWPVLGGRQVRASTWSITNHPYVHVSICACVRAGMDRQSQVGSKCPLASPTPKRTHSWASICTLQYCPLARTCCPSSWATPDSAPCPPPPHPRPPPPRPARPRRRRPRSAPPTARRGRPAREGRVGGERGKRVRILRACQCDPTLPSVSTLSQYHPERIDAVVLPPDEEMCGSE